MLVETSLDYRTKIRRKRKKKLILAPSIDSSNRRPTWIHRPCHCSPNCNIYNQLSKNNLPEVEFYLSNWAEMDRKYVCCILNDELIILYRISISFSSFRFEFMAIHFILPLPNRSLWPHLTWITKWPIFIK